MSGRAEQSTKKKKKKNEESSVAKKKTRLGLKDLTDNPKTRADAKVKIGGSKIQTVIRLRALAMQ